MLAGILVAAPVHSETLAERIAATPSGDLVSLAAEVSPGRADITAPIEIRGVAGSRLSAPDDDTILAVLQGAQLKLSGVDLVQEGQSKFAIYVDGGEVWLEDCRITGAFEVAIYVASGSLSITGCDIDGGLYGVQAAPGAVVTLANVSMTGQSDTAVRVDGAALDITELTVAEGGMNGLIVIGSPAFRADGLTLSGVLGVGLWVQDTTLSDLRRIVVDVSGKALTLMGGSAFRLDGFVLQGTEGAISAEAVGGEVALTRGRMQSGDRATAVNLRDIGRLRLDDVEIAGGETGLYLFGSLPGATFDRVFVHSQASTGLFVDGITSPDSPLAFSEFRGIALGTALPAYFRDSGPVSFARSGLMAEGVLPYEIEGASSPEFRESALFSAPDFAEGHLVFDATVGDPPSFLPVGPLWWSGDAAIVPGTVAMTLADLAESLPMDTGLRQAVVEFGTARAHTPKALALALDQALPVVQAAPEAAALALVDLAPPEAGWTWDAAAVRITLTGRDGVPFSVLPGDFPLVLAAGDYALALDGRAAGRITIDGETDLVLPLPDAPFYAWRDDQGQKWRGPALYLRPKAELAALLAGLRPLRPGEYWGYAPQFAPRAGADRALAATLIAGLRDRLPVILDDLAQHQTAEAWPAFNLRWQEADILLDIMAAFGSAEDAAWLLSLPVPEGAQINHLDAAALIEMRLGTLADGAALATARAWLAEGLPATGSRRQDLIRLAQSLSRSGLPEGRALLADLVRAIQAEPENGAPVSTGIVDLSRLDPTLAAGLPGQFLDRFATHLDAYLDGQLPADATKPLYLDLWNSAISTLVHEAVHAPPGSPVRRLPVPPNAWIGSSAWAFDDPLTALGGTMGLIGPPDPNRLSGWTTRFPEFICAALAYRSATDRDAQLANLRNTLTTAVGLVFADQATDPAALSDIFNQAAFALDVTLGECVLSDAVLNNFSRNAAGEEAAIFDNLDYEPLWWLRRPRTEVQLAAFARGEEYPALSGHSPVPLAEIEAMLATGSAADPDLQAAFLTRHQLLSDAFQGDFDLLTFGSEHRQFRLRSDAGNGSITIAGYLDIRPVLSKGRLIIAIRHRIESPDYGGLAAMITEPDRAPYEADNRLLMFEAVTLDRAGVETALAHEGTSANGVQFFAMPHQGDLSDQTLHLKLRFVDTIWEIDVPLWASVLAHDLRAGAASEVPE